MATIAKLYSDLVSALATVVDRECIFLGNRPRFSKEDAKFGRFVVIDIPDAVRDVAIGKHKLMLHTMGILSLFDKSKNDDTLRVNSMSDFIDAVTDLFPISGEYCVAANPIPLINGSDGYGYQVAEISFNLHTKRKND